MAVTIDAPPSRVWPWLVQMGTDRAGWYSWDRLDNWGSHSADRIHPEWQEISVGDRLAATPDGSEWWEVAALEPERFLGLRMSLDLRGRPFDPRRTRPALLHRLAVGLSARGAAGWPHPARRQRLLVVPAAVAAARHRASSSWSPRTGSCRRASSRTSSGTPSANKPPSTKRRSAPPLTPATPTDRFSNGSPPRPMG